LSEPPSALFTSQNLLTIGASRALHRLDLHHRIALVGFDDVLLPTCSSLGLRSSRRIHRPWVGKPRSSYFAGLTVINRLRSTSLSPRASSPEDLVRSAGDCRLRRSADRHGHHRRQYPTAYARRRPL